MNSWIGKTGVVIIEGHVQGLANTRALGKAGIPVIVINRHDCIAHYSTYCKKFFYCPDYISDKFIDFLIQLASTENLQGWALLPSNDHAVYSISMHRSRLQAYYKIISPEQLIFETIYNKELLIRLCLSIGIPVPLTWFPAAPEDIKRLELKYPLLIKGKKGLTFYKNLGKKAFLLSSPKDLEQSIETIIEKIPFNDAYFQNLLPIEENKTISFTAFSIAGEIKCFWMGMKIREHPINFGTATYSRSIYIPELIPLATTLLKKLGFTGVCEIEFLFDSRDQKYKLIEVNARTWLWVEMAIKSGINYPLMIYNYLNNIEMDYPGSYKAGKEWIHYFTDIPYSLMGVIKGHYTFGQILKSYSRFPSPAVLRLSDILPSLAFIVLSPSYVFRR